MEIKDISILSASRIKKWTDCSWACWCNYCLKLPSTSNSGASRGTACHLVFEMLLNKRHRHHFKKITTNNSIQASPPVARLVEKSLKRDGFYNQENLDLCDEMILVGLNNDFFAKGGKVIKAEQEFLIENDSPEYKVMGFIDKPVKYTKTKTIKLVDYKSSKNKFKDCELDGNIQSLVYSLAAKKLWPKISKNILVEFLFLRFPDQPAQQIEISDDGLKGFEYYLEHVFKSINNFTEKEAMTNFAADQPMPPRDGGFKGPLNCGFAKRKGQLKKNGDPMWHCEYKFPYDYYALTDKNGKTLKTAFKKKDLTLKEGQKITKKHYEGCPAHKHLHQVRDDFDF